MLLAVLAGVDPSDALRLLEEVWEELGPDGPSYLLSLRADPESEWRRQLVARVGNLVPEVLCRLGVMEARQ